MRYCDADSHFMEPFTWLEEVDASLARRVAVIRAPLDLLDAVLGEVLIQLPPTERPSAAQLLPSDMVVAVEALFDGETDVPAAELQARADDTPELDAILGQKGSWVASDRVEVLDELAIAVQVVNPTLALPMVDRARRDHGSDAGWEVACAYNSWAAETLKGRTDRLLPASLIEIDDVGRAVRELARMRDLGSRAFLPPLHPVGGRNLGDPACDPIWAAALELGMVPVLHLGRGEVELNPDWATVDGVVDARTYARMGLAHRSFVAQLAMSNLVYGGVFDRFPDLVVMCQEFGLAWIQNWVDNLGVLSLDGAKTFGGMFGWPYDRSPTELLEHNLRFTPLPGQRVDQIVRLFGAAPVLFCTDYPHPEGAADSAEYFSDQFANAAIGADDAAQFFSGNFERLFAAG